MLKTHFLQPLAVSAFFQAIQAITKKMQSSSLAWTTEDKDVLTSACSDHMTERKVCYKVLYINILYMLQSFPKLTNKTLIL